MKNSIIGYLLIIFGIILIITSFTIFPSESSFGSIYSIFGIFISLIGFNYFIRKFKLLKKDYH